MLTLLYDGLVCRIVICPLFVGGLLVCGSLLRLLDVVDNEAGGFCFR